MTPRATNHSIPIRFSRGPRRYNHHTGIRPPDLTNFTSLHITSLATTEPHHPNHNGTPPTSAIGFQLPVPLEPSLLPSYQLRQNPSFLISVGSLTTKTLASSVEKSPNCPFRAFCIGLTDHRHSFSSPRISYHVHAEVSLSACVPNPAWESIRASIRMTIVFVSARKLPSKGGPTFCTPTIPCPVSKIDVDIWEDSKQLSGQANRDEKLTFQRTHSLDALVQVCRHMYRCELGRGIRDEYGDRGLGYASPGQ